MSGFSERQEALTDVAFRTFGAPATWEGIPVPVIVRTKKRDEDDGYGGARIIASSVIVRVRASEVAQPKVGSLVIILSGRLAGRYVVRRGAMLDAKGVWDCPLEPSAADAQP